MERTENRIRALRDSAAEEVLRRIRRDRDTAHPRRFRDLLDIVARRLFDPELKVSDLWKETGIDPHNHVWFRELDPPTTPRGFIEAGRLDTAAEMLIRDPYGLEIWRIGEAVCYAPKTFGESFKRRFRMPPSEYRSRHGQGRAGTAIPLAETALLAGFPAAALDHLADADATNPRVAARLGLAWQGSACVDLKAGRIDDAYARLALAHRFYSVAGELPAIVARHRALTYVSCKTDEVLLGALCRPCRRHLLGDVGASLRRHLRDALVLLPTDLAWFQACCDKCYGVAWKAVQLARYGFLPNAWQAWWLAEHANLEDPYAHPSVGRYIAALSLVESLHFQDQSERLAMAERAYAEAKALGEPLLVAQGRLWVGNCLAASAQFRQAKKKLQIDHPLVANPWVAALHHRFSGLLDLYTDDRVKALGLLGAAARLYESLDLHVSGMLVADMGVVHFEMEQYDAAIELFRRSLRLFDDRRDPLPVHAAIPINLAAATGALGRSQLAWAELGRCRFDRARYPSVAAKEVFTRGCVRLSEDRHQAAVRDFSEAHRRFEELHQAREAALAASYSVESYYVLGEYTQAGMCCLTAARFFEAAGCPAETLRAVARLRTMVQNQTDARAVVATVRRLAHRHGGWVPVPAG